ncbi:MAG: prohibitin family protein [Gammaproteobacteria bacterium]|nr:prohibitin family protein [Gammaproteobacteria bacterium]
MSDPVMKFKNLKIPLEIDKKVILIGIIVAIFILFTASVGIVGAGQRGVLLRFGAVTGVIKNEGLYFKIPFVEQVVLMSTQIQKYSALATASSKDLQVVTTEVTLNYQLDPNKVGEIYRSMRQDYEARVIQPFVQEGVKSTAANFDAEQLITQRPRVKADLQNLISKRLALLGITVVELSITDFRFTKVFQDSIEAKVKAVQQALEAENALRRVGFEAQQAIVKATAEAKGLELQKAQISEQLLELRKIEVERAAVDKWNGVMPSVVTGGGPVPMLDVFRPHTK